MTQLRSATDGAGMRQTLFLIFAVSGFSGLIYESIWSHYLKLFLGHAAYAQTIVLAIFMGGMAIGATIAARYSARWRGLLMGYALVEGLVGVAALVFHGVFVVAIDVSHGSVLPALGSPALAQAYKWTLSGLLILPQSILLGMTFPLMSVGIIRRSPDAPGSVLAMLYFSNSIGAAIGVMAGGFFLIGRLGLPGTILTAGLINIGLALTIWALLKREGGEPLPARAAAGENGSAGDRHWYHFLLVAAAVTGLASFLYEIAWIRMLAMVLGSSTHAFELMLSAFITGLAFGGLYIRRRIDRLSDPAGYLGWVQVIMGILALSTLATYGNTFQWMEGIVATFSRTEPGYTGFLLASHGVALLLMLPATVCAGMTLPLMTYMLLRRDVGEKGVGAVYAANTVGAIIAVALGVHLLMPTIGAKGMIVLGGALDIALGMFFFTLASGPLLKRYTPALAAGAAFCVAAFALTVGLDPRKMASGVFRTGKATVEDGSEVLRHRDGKTATVSLVRNSNGKIGVLTNGKYDATIAPPDQPTAADEITQVLLGIIGLAAHPGAKTLANIGFGSGMTTHALLASPRPARVDSIEIEPEMVMAAREGFGDWVARAFNDPRSHIHHEDAKTFFSVNGSRYDVIISEPSNPWVSGVASLFTTEFYRQAASHLNPGGVLVQWIQLYEVDVNVVASIVKAMSPVFADWEIYAPDEVNLILLARVGGKLGKLDPAVLTEGDVPGVLRRVDLRGVADIEVRRIGGKALLEPLFASYPAPVNSDYFPYVDLNGFRGVFLQRSAHWITAVGMAPYPVAEMLEGVALPNPDRVTPYAIYSRTLQTADAARLARGDTSQASELPVWLHKDHRSARLHGSPCRRVDHMDAWLDAAFSVASSTGGHLTPEQSRALWHDIAPPACRVTLSPEAGKWLRLFEATGQRDARTMAEISMQLLTDGESRKSAVYQRYLVSAAMLGHLASGNEYAARELWQTVGARLMQKDENDLTLRLLGAHAMLR